MLYGSLPDACACASLWGVYAAGAGVTDVAQCVHKGETVLHYAARGGHTEVVEMLLGAGADAKAVDKVRAAMGGCALGSVVVYSMLAVFVLPPGVVGPLNAVRFVRRIAFRSTHRHIAPHT